jgi:DNA-binding response OmpR family regulator
MRILIIEDDAMIARFVKRGLSEDGGVVDVADTGEEGALLARVNDYDVIILDLSLPDIDGMLLAQGLREEGRTTPILMLTARTGTENLVKGLDAGADDYITKPFELAELRARLRALTRRGGAERTEDVQVGSLTLDRPRRTISVDGKRLKLTPKEYQLLEYFMLHRDEVVSRTDLLEKVWEMNFDPGSNVVDVHVARVRGKLRPIPGTPQLITVRGFGFRLTAAEPPGDAEESEA